MTGQLLTCCYRATLVQWAFRKALHEGESVEKIHDMTLN